MKDLVGKKYGFKRIFWMLSDFISLSYLWCYLSKEMDLSVFLSIYECAQVNPIYFPVFFFFLRPVGKNPVSSQFFCGTIMDLYFSEEVSPLASFPLTSQPSSSDMLFHHFDASALPNVTHVLLIATSSGCCQSLSCWAPTAFGAVDHSLLLEALFSCKIHEAISL